MKTVLESEILIAKAKKGNKYWQAFVRSENGEYFHVTTAWHDTAKGVSKAVTSQPYKIEQKNVGRANETTLLEQSKLEFDAIVKKQKEKGYLPEGEKYEGYPLPMLAQSYKKRAHALKWPVFVQPKLNGVRMLTDGVVAWSRGGKEYPAEIVRHILPGFKLTATMDGELILPNNVLLQETSRAYKKYREGITEQLQFHMYDCVDEKNHFLDRFQTVAKESSRMKNAVVVKTIKCNSDEEVMAAHAEFVKLGYEGTIIRDCSSGYEINRRSNQLQKLKDFVDGEFKIVNVIDGGGSFEGCAIFQCVTEGGEPFDCTPEGTMEHRKELYKTRKNHIGKWLTIRYQDLTEKGIPTMLVGVEVREKGEF